MKTNYQLTPDEIAVIGTIRQEIGNRIDPARSARENMVACYMGHYPNCSRDEAEEAVGRVVKGISTFTQNYEELKQNDGALDRKLDEALLGLDARQKYVCLLHLTTAIRSLDSRTVSALLSDAGADMFAGFEKLENSSMPVPGEVSEVQLAELEKRFKEAVSESTCCMVGSEGIGNLIRDTVADPAAARAFVGECLSDLDEKSYTALAACMAYRDGRLPSMPEGIEIESLALGIAAGVERNRVIADAESGLISWDTAFSLLKWIGGAVILGVLLLLTVKISVFGVLGTMLVVSGLLGGSIFGMLVGAVLGTVLMIQFGSWAADAICETLATLGRGYDKAVDYLRHRLVPAVCEKLRDFWNFLRTLFHRGKEAVNSGLSETAEVSLG